MTHRRPSTSACPLERWTPLSLGGDWNATTNGIGVSDVETQPGDDAWAFMTRYQQVTCGSQPTWRIWSAARPSRRLDYFFGRSSTSTRGHVYDMKRSRPVDGPRADIPT